MMNDNRIFNKRVMLCDDGRYRWTYEVNLYRNPMFFFLVWKIFFFIILGIFAVMSTVDIIEQGLRNALGNLPLFAYMVLGMTVLSGLGYLIYALIMGGRYSVEFEMDEKGIIHRQIPSQAEKARKIGNAAILAGAVSGRAGTMASGLSAQRTEMYTEFSGVKKVTQNKRLHVIKIKEGLEHNQVYTADEDFEFVLDYIISHCPGVKR